MDRRIMAGFLSLVLFPLLFPIVRQPTHTVARQKTSTQSFPAQQADAQILFGGALGFQYSPEVVFISPGDTVTWQGDFSMHPLVSDEGLWPIHGSGSQFSHTFEHPGVYRYHCAVHGGAGGVGMSGTVVVGVSIFLPLIQK